MIQITSPSHRQLKNNKQQNLTQQTKQVRLYETEIGNHKKKNKEI